MKKIRYILEFLFVYILMLIFRLLPLDRASGLGGWLGRTLGPHMGASRWALNNLSQALPEIPGEDRKKIIIGMWDNIGRILAEYPHLKKIGKERVEIAGEDHIFALQKDRLPAIVFSGHLGNWETMAPALFMQYGFPFHIVYRAPNNPHLRGLLDYFRSLDGQLGTIPKSRGGTRRLVESVADQEHIMILIDQKYNEGLPIPFFGRPAMTSAAFVTLAQKHNCPLVPFRVERLTGARFRLTYFPPLPLYDATGSLRPVEELMLKAHSLLESWIRERPEQWFWIHRRWPK